MIRAAGRAEYIGYALDATIRAKLAARRWYRLNRGLCWSDWEAETNRELRLLFRVRREGIRQHVDQEERARRAWAEAVEAAIGDDSPDPLPDVPLADPGDIFVFPAGVGR